MRITCDLPSRKPLGERSVMNGRCPSAPHITGRYIVLAMRDSGGLRRESTRPLMRCASGGTHHTEELNK